MRVFSGFSSSERVLDVGNLPRARDQSCCASIAEGTRLAVVLMAVSGTPFAQQQLPPRMARAIEELGTMAISYQTHSVSQ